MDDRRDNRQEKNDVTIKEIRVDGRNMLAAPIVLVPSYRHGLIVSADVPVNGKHVHIAIEIGNAIRK